MMLTHLSLGSAVAERGAGLYRRLPLGDQQGRDPLTTSNTFAIRQDTHGFSNSGHALFPNFDEILLRCIKDLLVGSRGRPTIRPLRLQRRPPGDGVKPALPLPPR
jgi:hypothetical protein